LYVLTDKCILNLLARNRENVIKNEMEFWRSYNFYLV